MLALLLLKILSIQQTRKEAIHGLRFHSLANAGQENVSGVHGDIWLSRQIFSKTTICKEFGEELAIAISTDSNSFEIPMPGEAHCYNDHLFYCILFERKSQ